MRRTAAVVGAEAGPEGKEALFLQELPRTIGDAAVLGAARVLQARLDQVEGQREKGGAESRHERGADLRAELRLGGVRVVGDVLGDVLFGLQW